MKVDADFPVFWGLMKLIQMCQLLHQLDFLDYYGLTSTLVEY